MPSSSTYRAFNHQVRRHLTSSSLSSSSSNPQQPLSSFMAQSWRWLNRLIIMIISRFQGLCCACKHPISLSRFLRISRFIKPFFRATDFQPNRNEADKSRERCQLRKFALDFHRRLSRRLGKHNFSPNASFSPPVACKRTTVWTLSSLDLPDLPPPS